MRSVHVLRKPCSEPTVADQVLSTGTGALNIDGTRVAIGSGEPDSGAMFYKNRGLPMPANKQSYFAQGDGSRVVQCDPIVGGRWPANLVLQHLEGCVQNGSKTVKGAGHYPSARSVGSQISGPSGHTGQVDLTERHLKKETVAVWACAEGCPVAALDAQSGVTYSAAGKRKFVRAGSTGWIERGGSFTPGREWESVGFGDVGGASRFFKLFAANGQAK